MVKRKFDQIRSVPGELIVYVIAGKNRNGSYLHEEVVRIPDEGNLNIHQFPVLDNRRPKTLLRRLREHNLGTYADRIQKYLEHFYPDVEPLLVVSRDYMYLARMKEHAKMDAAFDALLAKS